MKTTSRLFNIRHPNWFRFCLGAWIVLASWPACAVPPFTVLNYWRMGENDIGAAAGATATNAVDSVGTNNLAYVGPATYTRGVSPAAFTQVGSTLCVNFTNSTYAIGPVVSTLQNNFGIEAWVKPAAFGGPKVIAYNGGTGGPGGSSGWGIFLNGSSYAALYGGEVVFGAAPATSNVWTHVALVRTNGVATLFVNGVAAGASSGVTPATPSGHFAIGAPPQNPTSQFFAGLIDEVRCFECPGGIFTTDDLLLNNPGPTFALGTGSLLEGNSAGVDSVTLGVSVPTAAWTATTNASWLHLSAANQSGIGSTNVVFNYDANSGATRCGAISIAGLTLTVTQVGSSYLPALAMPNLVSNVNFPNGVAVDGGGDVFFTLENAIGEWTPASNTVTYPFNTGTNDAWDVAVDGAGNLYIADDYGIAEVATASTNLTYLVTGVASSQGVAVDGAGNVYFTDHVNGLVQEWTAANSNVTTLSSGFGILTGVAVDVAGNVFSTGYSAVIDEWTAANGQTIPILSTNLNTPEGLAVDGAGNLYIADTQNSAVEKWTVATQTLSTLPANGLAAPQTVAVDDAGDLFVADSTSDAVLELPHAFVDTNSVTVPAGAGEFALPVVLPATANLNPPYNSLSDASWLTVTNGAPGLLTFSVTENTGALRTAHVTVLGQTIPITQQIIGTPPTLVKVSLLGGDAIRFSFTNNPNASFTVLSSTNLSLPAASWTPVGAPVFTPPDIFQFASPLTASNTQLFYIVHSP